MTVYISDMSEFASLNSVYSEFFTINPPPRVTVETSLPFNRKLQIDCLVSHLPKTTLHVQGISYWAPANIGPYSQAVIHNSTLLCAGQIGLIPASMKLADGIVAQTHLSISHVEKVIKATMPRANEEQNLVYATCYITDIKHAQFVRDCWRERYGVLVPLAVVALAGLPRGASVEWCVVCGEGDNVEYSYVHEDWELEVMRRGGMLGALAVVKGHDSKSVSNVREKLESALDEIKWDVNGSIMFARVFYARGVNLDSVKDLACLFKGLIEAFTFVEVDGIDGGDIAFLVHGSASKAIELDET